MPIDSTLIIPPVHQDTDTPALSETFVIPGGHTHILGSGLNPAYPTGAQLIPKGAGPLTTPNAPTAGSAITTGALVDNGTYKWAVTFVSQWGETLPSSQLTQTIGLGNHGQTLFLPAWNSRPDNPVTALRIYRTLAGGSQLKYLVELDDVNISTYVDEISDTELTTNAPTSDTSGSLGAVTVYDGSSFWTEVADGTTLTTQHFSVDYTVTATGGTIKFAVADVGTSVTVTYYAGTLLGSVYLNQYKTAFQSIYDFVQTDATAEFHHNLLVDSQLEVLGIADLDGALDVAGASVLNGTLAVTGATTLSSTLHLIGAGTFDSTLDITGGTTLHGTTHGIGAVTFDSTLNVTGATTLSSTLHLVGAGTFDSTLAIAGNSSVGGTFSVASTSIFTGLVSTAGGINLTTGDLNVVAGNFNVQNASSSGSFNGTLTVTGATTLNNNLTVNGQANIANLRGISANSFQLFVNNDLIVQGRFVPQGTVAASLIALNGGDSVNTITGVPHNDSYGTVRFHTGATPVAGGQFSVGYGTTKPISRVGVFLSVALDNDTGTIAIPTFYPAFNNNSGFEFVFRTAPAANTDYYVTWLTL